ncbi:MAG: hypothetical protein HOY71_11310 [Nonomuraea sp.]|nr:hypothetical protein [Nonomuraea sp.]
MTLTDRFLAAPDFAERHELVIPAPRDAVWAAWQQLDLRDPPALVRALFGVRGLVARVRHGHAHRDIPQRFLLLASDPPCEEVKGVVGTWWTIGGGSNRVDLGGPEGFVAFAEPGYGKAVISMRLEAVGASATRAITETRVLCTDEDSRRAMARYWWLIRPFSGLIRRVMLRALRDRVCRS